MSVMSIRSDNDTIVDRSMKMSGYWVISAEKIFSSEMSNFKEFARIFDVGFSMNEFSVIDGPKFADSVVQAHDVTVSMPLGSHVVMVQKYLAKRTVLKKILIKRLVMINNKLSVVDELEFNDAKFQSFSIQNDLVSFSFRYHTYSYSYTSYKNDGSKGGTSAMSVDAKWDVK